MPARNLGPALQFETGLTGTPYAVATYRQDAQLATYRIPNTTNLGYTYSIVPGEFTFFNPTNPAFASNAANYNQFEFGTTLENQREEALTARANISYNLEPEDRGFGLAAGGYLRFLDRTFDFTQDNYRPAANNAFRLSSVLAPETFAPYNGNGQTLLFVDPAGQVVEGSIWNLGLWDGDTVTWPEGPALRGTAERLLQAALTRAGVPQRSTRVRQDDLGRFKAAFACNASGLQPVVGADAVAWGIDTALMTRLAEVFEASPWEPLA